MSESSEDKKKKYVFFLEGEDLVKEVNDTLFDRIINLKFKNKKGDEFILRSDYEAIFPTTDLFGGNSNIKEYYIRKCAMKPSIKVQYKQVSSGDVIQLNVFVQNFFMLDENGNIVCSFSSEENHIVSMEIQMGYWAQFKDMPHDTYEDLFDFKNENGVRTIKCNVEYVTTDKLPPDATLCIHGWIGSSFSNTVKKEAFKFETKDLKASEGEELLKEILFKSITKRFWRGGIEPEGVNDSWFNPSGTNYEGTLKDKYAEEYGTKVFISDGVKFISGRINKSKLTRKDAEGKEFVGKVESLSGNTVLQALNDIRKQFSLKVGFKQLLDGNYIMFTVEEGQKPEELEDKFSEEDRKVMGEVKIDQNAYDKMLPAVYNISKDALCTITCPFYYFLDPFDSFYFASRYSLSGLVDYYANYNEGKFVFYALWMSVSFATVEDMNECTIACV